MSVSLASLAIIGILLNYPEALGDVGQCEDHVYPRANHTATQ